MASSDWFKIKISGKQTHGAYPWLGIDPIVTAISNCSWITNYC
jgi:metal-dependent amidase/aminoacylase/carboxypeptidase family protein